MTKTNYFTSCTCIEEVKQQYKELALLHHPDIAGGSTAAMQTINSEYEILFSQLKNTHKNVKGETYTSTNETTETHTEYMDIINKIIHFEGCKIEICGSWIWITGNTKEYKDILKELHFTWCKNKLAWSYHNTPFKKRTKNKYDMDAIRSMFGSEEVQNKPLNKLQFA